MGAARLSFLRMPDVGFWKLCGSGTGEGFTPRPNTAVWAILATWPDPETARNRTQNAPVYRRWHAHAAESWTILMEPTSARGQWSGRSPFTPTAPQSDGPVVALTRATMRARTFLRFWARVPDISNAIGRDPDVIFKIGIGEVPFLHQITFSIWPDAAAMARFARGDGPHGRAIQAVRAENWFAEELYARFRILDDWGSWGGASPLAEYAA
jgi:spheroidene monooxygenase